MASSVNRPAHDMNAWKLDRDEELTTIEDQRHRSLVSAAPPSNAELLHSVLLLSDSALPLGSFAFSSGLESFLAHNATKPKEKLLRTFLLCSIASVARLALPYLLKAHQTPQALIDLDDEYDAMTLCPVARRASTAQGQALLTVWEKSFRMSSKTSVASTELNRFSKRLKGSQSDALFRTSAHLAPIFGVIAAAFEINQRTAASIFLLNHTKSILSAAVRSGVIGPFQSHAILFNSLIREEIESRANAIMTSDLKVAGQIWVAGDVWIGRHELLYSRIFNS